MALLPMENAIQRFKENEERIDVFVNESDTTDVLPRTGGTYPTLRKAMRQLFENGGLPATPFTTLQSLNSSGLTSGFGMVTDDSLLSNNGLYYHNGNNWVKSRYDVKGFIDDVKYELIGGKRLAVEFIDGAVTPSTSNNIISILPSPDRQYIKIDVSGQKRVVVEGASDITSETSNWHWTVVNENITTRLYETTFTGSGAIDIPEGGYYLIRNAKLDGIQDINIVAYDREVEALDPDTFIGVNNKLDDKVDVYKEDIPLSYTITEGATIATDHDVNPHIEARGPDRSYMSLDVRGLDRLVVSNSVGRPTDLDWVFSDASGKKIGFVKNTGNGTFAVPIGAVKAYRTFKMPASYGFVESSDISLVGRLVYPRTPKQLYEDIKLAQAQAQAQSSRKSFALDLIKNSNMPLYKLSDFEGADSDTKIRAALSFIKKTGKGILDFEQGTHIVESAILLPSNCWLYLNDATIKLKDGVFDNIIRSEGIEVPADPYQIATVIHESTNVRIFGNGSDVSTVSGPDTPYAAVNPVKGGDAVPWTGDWYGWRTIGILLANVKDYDIHDFSMVNGTAWAMSMGHGCEDFEVYNLRFDNRSKNGDGVHMVVGCKNGYIHDISGYTLDDMVAITATRDFVVTHPKSNYVYPMAVGGWVDQASGVDVTDITIENIKGSGRNQGVRLLCSGGAKLQKITVNNISDDDIAGFSSSTVILGTGYGTNAEWEDIKYIYINNVTSNFSSRALRLNAKISDSAINKIVQNNSKGVAIDESAATLRDVSITNTVGYP